MRSVLKFSLCLVTWAVTSLFAAGAVAQTTETKQKAKPAPVPKISAPDVPAWPTPTVNPPQPQSPKASKNVRTQTTRPSRVTMVKDQEPVAPQVVTIVHRLSGMKLLRQFLRERNEQGAIATIRPETLNSDVHASIIAGLALADGKTIVARLPQVNAEMEVQRALIPPADPDESGDGAHHRAPRPPRIQPDLTVMTQDGKTYRARYVGVDGMTGLSVLQLSQPATTVYISEAIKKISDGQNVQLYAPEQVSSDEPYKIFVRIGKTEAKVAQARIKSKMDLERVFLRGGKLLPNVLGGVACDESGHTLGIVDAIEGGNARLLTATAVAAATERVLERQSSVPRPLLGIRGEEVDSSSKKTLLGFGWSDKELDDLMEKEVGIILTSVLPGTPAAMAKLKPGDVIVRVNGNDVKGAEEFSQMLTKAGSGEEVKFTVERPQLKQSISVEVKLGGAYQPSFEWRFEMPNVPKWATSGLRPFGIEAIPLSHQSASQWGGAGLLVIGVEPESAAARAGLKERDVIESINGRIVGRGAWTFTYPFNKKAKQVFSVVRQKEKKQVVIEPVD